MNIYTAETDAENLAATMTNWKRPFVIDNTAAYIAHREAIDDPMSESELLHWRLCQLHGIDFPIRYDKAATKYTHRGWLRYRQPLKLFQLDLLRKLRNKENDNASN